MKLIRIIKLEKDDPPWQRDIEEAFNRVISFATELLYSAPNYPGPEAKLFNKVTCNGEFTPEELEALRIFGEIVANRAVAGAKRHPQALADSIDQAAIHLRDVLSDFESWIRENSI